MAVLLESSEGFREQMTCSYCKEPATKGVIWADGRGRICVCDRHVADARKTVAGNNDEVDEIVSLKEAMTVYEADDFESVILNALNRSIYKISHMKADKIGKELPLPSDFRDGQTAREWIKTFSKLNPTSDYIRILQKLAGSDNPNKIVQGQAISDVVQSLATSGATLVKTNPEWQRWGVAVRVPIWMYDDRGWIIGAR